MNLKNIVDNIDVWVEWRENYKTFVPKFIDEASQNKNWNAWDPEIFNEYFERSNDQCVSSLQQGYFTNKEKDKIKANWQVFAPLLKQIADSQDIAVFDIYTQLKSTILQWTDSNKEAAVHRMVAGLQPKLLTTVVSYKYLNELYSLLTNEANITIDGYTYQDWFRDSNLILKTFKAALPDVDFYDLITYPWQTLEFLRETDIKSFSMELEHQKIISLLTYKKQIILQGPPGTGKTRLAKEIAKDLIPESKDSLTKEVIISKCQMPQTIPAARTKMNFKILGTNATGVRIVNSENTENTAPFDEIIRMSKERAWEKEGAIVNGTHSYSAAVAKFLDNILDTGTLLNDEYCKIIQFHPSYSYEDFVRGIMAKPNEEGEGMIYEGINKTLGLFAEKALKNYQESKSGNSQNITSNDFDAFVAEVLNRIDIEEKYMISDKVYIFFADKTRFKYKGDNWTAHPNGLNMNFSELKKILGLGLKTRQEIVQNESLNSLTRQHATYYQKVLDLYNRFVDQQPKRTVLPTQLRNYVLIIDEINRANLSSVLGELIYALEYRGEYVDSIYEVEETILEDRKKLCLPPNLYIIGTMNTADRSVGHIDYAIRRRFAFVDVLPKDLSRQLGADFHSDYFNKIKDLFYSESPKHLSEEFKATDVCVGHSYFIQQFAKDDHGNDDKSKPIDFKIRLKYEIIPILEEYVKDGVLKETANIVIEKLKEECQ